MSDIQLYLLEVDTNKAAAQQIAQQSANKLETRQVKLSDVIASVGAYINDEGDAVMRAKSVAYLADVLEKVPPRALALQERRLLTGFVLGRMEGDVEGSGASARALLALEKLGKWDAETAQRAMTTFVSHTHPLRQFPLQTDRYAILQLLDLLVARYRPHMKQLHEHDPEWLRAFISYFDGEKDPRNLMVIFSLVRVPMAEWELGGYAQDMFDAVFNYFPITFRPPEHDPYGITAQDLKDRLRDCIAATSDVAPYAFPALLDKLDSTSINTKRDVLVAIQACVTGYSTNTIHLYSVTLWDALKFEIITVQDEHLAKEALKALALIARKFANADAPLNAYLRPIIKECNEHLEDAPTKQSQGAGRILLAIAKTGSLVADKIAKGILPTLFSLYSSASSIAKRRGLLEVYNHLVDAYLDIQNSGGEVHPESLHTFVGEATQAMLHALAKAPSAEVSFRLTALQGLSKLVRARKVLSEEQTGLAVGAIVDVVLHERIEGHGDIKDEAIKSLTEIARSLPDSIRSQAVPAFMVQLPDFAEDRKTYGPVLEAFAQLSREQQVFDTIALRIMNKLKAARYQNAPKHYQKDLLLALLYCFTNGVPLLEDGVLRSSYFTDYAQPLIQQVREALPSQRDDMTTDIIGRITNIILRQQTPHFQSTVYNKNVDWLSSASTDGVGKSTDELRAFAPFLLYYYAAIRPEIAEANDVLSSLRAQSTYLLGSDTDPIGFTIALRHVSLLVNKFFDPKAVDKALEDAGLEVSVLLSGGNSTHKLDAAFAVVKALLIQGRSGALTSKYLQLLLQNLAVTDRSFARRFAGLLAPDDILTKENHCTVSGLYKQKTFGHTIPAMIENVKTAEPSVKPNYLIAMSGILRWLPYALMESSLPSLAPSLLQSLDLNDAADQEVKYSTLTIFESLLMHDAQIAEEHSASLITRLLNSTSTPGNQAKVRAKALQCLSLVPRQLKREAVVPYRRPVVKKLLGCLDDGKRSVRHEAVKCRSAWLALDEGTEEEE
ncbi:uncharacterized protein MYCFIDRAFT_158718 [Pseudocercospora fijiensis CIRAD86]|uniref:MMS19 nucleotide excision repair protein n=1 Tax=Pseudocercospora fijiensis (strain CIRAD86) TaxID=383855 RepID=N1Q5Y3_PSEFD|nr:uncharacterized protein MYCFIDRAFT_158718 [Pseudocercospora fijiensis CIRAD86]EME87474.1 hypothetical protein MYCFIDRAFT_158718 [Pseudocercospora fijiensis CIRAD86]